MSLVRNEGVKLLAATLNGVGTAAMVTGVVAPAAGFVHGVGNRCSPFAWRTPA